MYCMVVYRVVLGRAAASNQGGLRNGRRDGDAFHAAAPCLLPGRARVPLVILDKPITIDRGTASNFGELRVTGSSGGGGQGQRGHGAHIKGHGLPECGVL